MGRTKQTSKHDSDDDDDDVIEEPVKVSKKKVNKEKEVKETKVKEKEKEKEKEVKKSSKKVKDESDDEDDESNEFAIDTSNIPLETKKSRYDVNKPLGECTLMEVFDYLIELGTDNMNPQLRQGALDLKNTLQGKRPKPNTFNGNTFNNNYRGGFRGGRGGYNNQGNTVQANSNSNGVPQNPRNPQASFYGSS